MDEQKLAATLLARRDDLEALVSENKIVDDVIDGRTAIISRTSRKADQTPLGIAKAGPVPINTNFGDVTGFNYNVGANQSRYLPKRDLESADEYQRRLDMTPFFPETPGVLQSRQGALFRKPPDFQLPDPVAYLLSRATCAGMSFIDVIVKIAEMVQVGGFAGICVDREALPDGVDPEQISVSDAQRLNLGQIILAPYAAHQIRGWGTDDKGLKWVRIVEQYTDSGSWDSKPKERYTVRIVDRKKITLYDVKKSAKKGQYKVSAPTMIAHGATDAGGNGVVPFRLFHPFPARDGTGRSNLRASAEADVASTRMLSELLWLIHMCAPILTLITNRPPERIKDIGLGMSFLNVLQAKQGDLGAEELKFVQLDPIAIDRLMTMYDRLTVKAREQANKSADVGVTGPVQQSGISKAWTFKTGEERVLFLLSVCLQEGFQWILDLACRMAGAGESVASIKFPQTYDITGIPEQISIADRVMPILAEYGLNTAAIHTLKALARNVMSNATDEEIAASDREVQALSKRDLRPSAPLAAPLAPSEREPVTEGDSVS